MEGVGVLSLLKKTVEISALDRYALPSEGKNQSRPVRLTPYHAKYFAHELTLRRPSDSVEKLAGALLDAQVDLHPHQVEAALFAFRSLTIARQEAIQRTISERNGRFFEAEAEKLEGWAEDLKLGLEREIKELDRQIKEARRTAMTALTLENKLAGQKQIKALESQRSQKRRALFEAQDEIDKKREQLITIIEGKLTQATQVEGLFLLRWAVV